MATRFDGAVAIVTGAAGGIGSATCRRLAAQGARVVVADVDATGAEALAVQLGDAATPIAFDLGDPESVERLVAETVRQLGRLDVLVNNAAMLAAGTATPDTTIEDLVVDTWRRMLEVNVIGSALACKHAIPHLRASGGGSIVNITSEQAIRGANVGSAYSASKAGIISLTLSVATQCGRDGIRCNAVAPGLIGSPRIREAVPQLIEAVMPHLLIGRIGEPEDVADLICFLASREAAYVTGQVYAVDGGYLAHLPAPG
jgi:NAD(P)-dependent dehydrogenase (short-subunit alcohol dehydrogenase family)